MALTRPGNSVVTATASGTIVTTPTSVGGIPAPGGPPAKAFVEPRPQPVTLASASPKSRITVIFGLHTENSRQETEVNFINRL
jgi:hypothetical protein